MLSVGLLLVIQIYQADEKLNKWYLFKKTQLGFKG